MKACLRLLLFAALLSVGNIAKATLISGVDYRACDPGCANFTFIHPTVQDGSALSYSDQYGSVFAQAAYGTLKASVDSSFVGDGHGGFITESSGSAFSQFSDWIAFGGITGPQLVTIVIHIDGELGTVGEEMSSTSANVFVSLNVNGHYLSLSADRFGTVTTLNGTYSQTVLTTVFSLDYGVQLSLDGALAVNGDFGGYAHYGHTASLEFIAPEGTTIQSGSGTAYRLNETELPEPGTFALLALGLAILFASRSLPWLAMDMR